MLVAIFQHWKFVAWEFLAVVREVGIATKGNHIRRNILTHNARVFD